MNGYPATSVQALAQGIVNLTCQGNSSSSLNALNLRDERDEDEFTGTSVLSFRPNNRVLLYGSYSHGYKAGGFNLDRSALGSPIFAPTDPRQFGGRSAGFNTGNLQFDAETVDAFELGFKYTGRNFTVERRRLPSAVQQFPAEHVQRLGLPGPEHQRLQRRAGQFDDQGITMPADQDASTATGACAADDVDPWRADHRHRDRGAAQSGAASAPSPPA